MWARRLAACERSGLSRRAWCAAQGVNVHTLDYWRYVLPLGVAQPDSLRGFAGSVVTFRSSYRTRPRPSKRLPIVRLRA
jgi:hypothetical protein